MAAVLPKGRSSTANSGAKVAVLPGMNRCGSFPLLSALQIVRVLKITPHSYPWLEVDIGKIMCPLFCASKYGNPTFTWLTPPGPYRATTCRERELTQDHIHTFLTTQGHGGPPRMSDQFSAGATSETTQTRKTIHTKHTFSHPNKANIYNIQYNGLFKV